MTDIRTKQNLITEIQNLLDEPNKSLVLILRRASRLAEIFGKEEYRLLFDLHIVGIDIRHINFKEKPKEEDRRIRQWSDINKIPQWNPLNFFESDRKVNNGVYYFPIDEIEHSLNDLSITKNKLLVSNLFNEVGQATENERQLRNILFKVRNRIIIFIREVEVEINSQIRFLQETNKAMQNYAEKEFSVLKTIYDLSSGIPKEFVLIADLEKNILLPYNELNTILIDLEKRKHLIGSVEQAVWIEPLGIEEIEKSKKHPEQSTNNFPANSYTTNIYGSATGFQVGGENNTQNISVTSNTEFDKVIASISELIKASKIPDDDKDECHRELQEINKLALKEPTEQVIERAKMRVNLLDTALKTTDIALKVAPYIPQLIAFIDSWTK